MVATIEKSAGLLADYRGIVPAGLIESVQAIANRLKGLRVVHVNSTREGGGVAEILRSLVPLMDNVGLDVSWHVINASEEFFQVTKKLHNLLQGAEGDLSDTELEIYESQAEEMAAQMKGLGITADVWVMHDPQSLPLASLLPDVQRALWVCHIDTSAPNKGALTRLTPWMQAYSRILFSMEEYVVPGLNPSVVSIVRPAIDPLSLKNRELSPEQVRAALERLGVDPSRPLMTQVARFDRWKDPWGVIDAYRMVKREIPGVQLGLLGVIAAQDDPEAYAVVESVKKYAGDDPDIHLFTDPGQVGEQEVAAFQLASGVILQKSLREGFGLSVTEAMWHGTPVVGGNCGGIRCQIDDGVTGFLVNDVPECAERVKDILTNPAKRERMGNAAREVVREKFLMPRLLKDYLEQFESLIS